MREAEYILSVESFETSNRHSQALISTTACSFHHFVVPLPPGGRLNDFVRRRNRERKVYLTDSRDACPYNVTGVCAPTYRGQKSPSGGGEAPSAHPCSRALTLPTNRGTQTHTVCVPWFA